MTVKDIMTLLESPDRVRVIKDGEEIYNQYFANMEVGTGSHCTDETGGNTGLFFQRFAVVYIPHNHDIAGR